MTETHKCNNCFEPIEQVPSIPTDEWIHSNGYKSCVRFPNRTDMFATRMTEANSYDELLISAAGGDGDTKAITELLKPVGFETRVIPITLAEYNAAVAADSRPAQVIHECKSAAFLLHELAEPALTIRDMDGEIPSYTEFEDYAITESFERFPIRYVHCAECETLRLIWLRVQLRFAIHTIKSEQCRVSRDARTFNELARAIRYELEISRDMDSEK